MKVRLIENNQILVINDRWEMTTNGAIYDTKYHKDIPQWIFEFRDFILEHHKNINTDEEISFEKSGELKKIEAINTIVNSNLSTKEKIVLLELIFSL